MRHHRTSHRARTRAGLLLAVVLASVGAIGVWHRVRPAAEPEAALDPALVHRVDLNRADRDEIAALPGIGDVLASRVVASRSEEGEFERIESLARVHGIGPGIVERVRPHAICEPERP